MAKKSRKKASRRRRSSSKIRLISEQPRAKEVRKVRGLSRDFNPDYQFVVQDLKRIGLITGTLVTFLIALFFFLR